MNHSDTCCEKCQCDGFTMWKGNRKEQRLNNDCWCDCHQSAQEKCCDKCSPLLRQTNPPCYGNCTCHKQPPQEEGWSELLTRYNAGKATKEELEAFIARKIAEAREETAKLNADMWAKDVRSAYEEGRISVLDDTKYTETLQGEGAKAERERLLAALSILVDAKNDCMDLIALREAITKGI